MGRDDISEVYVTQGATEYSKYQLRILKDGRCELAWGTKDKSFLEISVFPMKVGAKRLCIVYGHSRNKLDLTDDEGVLLPRWTKMM